MVARVFLIFLLGVASGHSAEPAAFPVAASVTLTADAKVPVFEKNHPVEDFFTVSLTSLPFTALWSLVGATVVGGISQNKFPPEFNDNMLIGAGAVALGASFSIGLVSVFWGKGKAPAASPQAARN